MKLLAFYSAVITFLCIASFGAYIRTVDELEAYKYECAQHHTSIDELNEYLQMIDSLNAVVDSLDYNNVDVTYWQGHSYEE